MLSQSSAIEWILYPLPTSFAFLILALISSHAALQYGAPIYLDGPLFLIICLLFVPFTLSLVFVPVNFLVDRGIYDAGYFQVNNLWGRVINFFLYMYLFMFAWSALRSPLGVRSWRWITGVYFWTIGAFILCGLWQWTHMHLHIPFPDFAALHTNIHSVSADVEEQFAGRLTSFFREPSYFASFLWDFIVLIPLFLRGMGRTFVLLAALFCLVFSYSLGGVVQAAVMGFGYTLISLYLLMKRWKMRLWAVVILLCLTVGFLLVLPKLLELIVPITARLQRFSLDPLREIRLQEIYAAFLGNIKGTWTEMLFGRGPAAYSLLVRHDVGLGHTLIHTTSNCAYADILFEQGFVGLAAYLALLWITLSRSLTLTARDNAYKPLPLLTFCIIGSGIYKADHNTLRYWVLLLIISGPYFARRERGFKARRSDPQTAKQRKRARLAAA